MHTRTHSTARLVLAGAVAAALLAAPAVPARPPIDPAPPAGALAEGTVIIPERFLRRWDPVTVFFPEARGPAGGGPEDDPAGHASLSPPHPGAWSWIDGRTLQFSPADPWPALTRFTVRAGEATASLATLMSPPRGTVPVSGAAGLDPVEEATLTFPEPLEPAALARMLSVELRPLPGIDGTAARRLAPGDYTIKAVERRAPSDAASYVVRFAEPVPWGTRALLRLRLSLDGGPGEVLSELAFSTAEPFRVRSVWIEGTQLPISPAGSRYGREQAIRGRRGARAVFVNFSAAPADFDPVKGRNLVRFTPAVEGISFRFVGEQLEVRGKFRRETLYRLALVPTALRDGRGRPLDMRAESELYFSFPRLDPFLQWGEGEGILERDGPQVLPLEGRGDERVDLRVYRVDPLDRSFWPFPPDPVTVDESRRPPGPGEEPAPFAGPAGRVSPRELPRLLAALGSPPVSAIVDLPLSRDGGRAAFGLDVSAHLAHLAGAGRPGHYLVGLRRLDGSPLRAWRRVQVTDLSLTTVEEPRRVRFLVSSLATGEPVAGATVTVEADVRAPKASAVAWETVYEGTTDAEGTALWEAPGDQHGRVRVQRIAVRAGEDLLVLDPARAPERFADNLWAPSGERWLQWTQEPLAGRGEQPQWLVHLFPERPVYRPDEKVYLTGFVRRRHRGRLAIEERSGFLVVNGPGGVSWRYPVTVSAAGSVAYTFREEKLPTGVYTAALELTNLGTFGFTSFRIEAYRIPRFEVALHAPREVPLDREFDVGLTAEYYAGGRVAGRPVQWRVTQYPYTWTPKKRAGFYYSSDGRFSRTGAFRSTPRISREDVTDEEGSASLSINPAAEPTAQPRTWVVEATVTGADDQTVTATREVRGLPPFVLGLKVPRYLERAEAVEPEIIAAGPDGELLEGLEVTVRLLHRRWHSVLQAGDFSEGAAKYVTDVVDEKVREETVVTGSSPATLRLPLEGAGVYVVELEARDRLERAQAVAVDLFAGGEEPVAWPKPEAGVFTVTPDRERYDPGERATLVLNSPFREARALAVIEAPGGNEYRRLRVERGQATLEIEIDRTYVPRLPVHVVLFRGRLPDTGPLPGTETDPGKPATLAATTWVEVAPVENRVEVSLAHPAQALPGREVEVTVRLADAHGAPLAGEVALWLVDQAVLALGKEQRLDPLPDFVTDPRSHLAVRDTRGLVAGQLPFRERAGGGFAKPMAAEAMAKRQEALLDRVTVRRRFETVPYYEPALRVGPEGTATVTVRLPDNLTNFSLRAKAVSGAERFGYATGRLEVRLPLIVQPALPRFVRPGDRFAAAAVGRVVEGEGGPGRAEMRIEGGVLDGTGEAALDWEPNVPQRVEFPVEVETPAYDEEGRLARTEVVVKAAVTRDADGAGDGFEVRLPLRDDRERVVHRALVELRPGVPAALPPVEEAARPGSVRRTVLVSDQPALVRMAGAVSFLMEYPYGCTEQQVSRARVHLAMKRFREILRLEGGDELLDREVEETLAWIASVVEPASGLAAYWPGGTGRVSLTAWVLEFLTEARAAGYPVDGKLYDGFVRVLTQALRSDYSRFIDGEAFTERAMALAALAAAGRFDRAYAAELSRTSQFLTYEGKARVLLAAAGAPEGIALPSERAKLGGELRDGVVVRLHQGAEVYAGLREEAPRSAFILPGETRTVASMARALARAGEGDGRLQLLVDALVRLGRGDGWGTTNANAEALLALGEVLEPPFAGSRPLGVRVRFGDGETRLHTGPDEPVGFLVSTSPAAGEVSLESGDAALLRAETSYLPAADGSRVAPEARGFVVSRELERVGGEDVPAEKVPLGDGGREVAFAVGDVVEEHVRVVNPADRHYVAVVVPLAAGMEPLNPALATAPPEAKPRGRLTLPPTYVAFLDDAAAFYYDTLPKGTYDFHFRTRAVVAGSFIQPPAKAEMMYNGAVTGRSAGARVTVGRGR